MAEKFQIYLKDTLTIDNTPAKRTIQEIRVILTDIAPGIVIFRIIPTPQGFIVSYLNDLDINFIFDTVKFDKLIENSLVASLSNDTQLKRDCVITGLTNDIFNKSVAELILNINQNPNINVVLLSKHDSEHNNRKYFFITLDSKLNKEQVIANGTLNIFESSYTVLESYSKRKPTYHRPRSTPQTFGFRRVLQQPTQGQGHFTPPILNQIRQSYSQTVSVPIDTSKPPPINWIPFSSNRPQHFYPSATHIPKDIDIKLQVELSSKICEVLSYGMENPVAYVSLMNQLFSKQGLTPINISDSDLQLSRQLYLQKTTLNPASSQTATNSLANHPIIPQCTVSQSSVTTPTISKTQLPLPQSTDNPPSTPVSSTSPPTSVIDVTDLTQTLPVISSTHSTTTTSTVTTQALSSIPISSSSSSSLISPTLPPTSPSPNSLSPLSPPSLSVTFTPPQTSQPYISLSNSDLISTTSLITTPSTKAPLQIPKPFFDTPSHFTSTALVPTSLFSTSPFASRYSPLSNPILHCLDKFTFNNSNSAY